MLKLNELHARYGKSHILHGVSMDVHAGEIVSLLGRNGSGRSTTVKTVMGLVAGQGSVQWHNEELLGKKPFEIARRGLGYVPESRDIFPTMSVHNNLRLGEKAGRTKRPRWSIEDMYGLFPQLKERRDVQAGALSGGEQQVLALCRTLMGDPDLVMMDEPTEGLAPKLVDRVRVCLEELRRRGVAVLLVEHKLALALEVSERCYVMGHGRIVFEGSPAALRAQSAVRKAWLEV